MPQVLESGAGSLLVHSGCRVLFSGLRFWGGSLLASLLETSGDELKTLAVDWDLCGGE